MFIAKCHSATSILFLRAESHHMITTALIYLTLLLSVDIVRTQLHAILFACSYLELGWFIGLNFVRGAGTRIQKIFVLRLFIAHFKVCITKIIFDRIETFEIVLVYIFGIIQLVNIFLSVLPIYHCLCQILFRLWALIAIWFARAIIIRRKMVRINRNRKSSCCFFLVLCNICFLRLIFTVSWWVRGSFNKTSNLEFPSLTLLLLFIWD